MAAHINRMTQMLCVAPLSISKARLHFWKIKPYEKDQNRTTLCFCCLSLSSHTPPTEIQVGCNQTPRPGGRKSNFTCHTHKRLFMQVGWRCVWVCVCMFKNTSLEVWVCLCGLCEWVVWARVLPKGISTKGGKHTCTHSSGGERRCVCVRVWPFI